ncbi:MAG: hypothetical protein RBS81_07265 [Tenuifilaceae bacterium]|nr:hypothetical protein [Tenuifilaceae bacterium]
MKKMIIGVAMLLFANVGFGQVSDNAVIPVSVTLNSILRLTVESGGNIQFVVNTIEDYTTGIANSTRYITNFNVASSRNFNVLIYSESDKLYGMNYFDDGINPVTPSRGMDLDNIGFSVTAGAAASVGTNNASSVIALSTSTTPVLGTVSAGSSTANQFSILWQLGTQAGGMKNASLLSQSITADTYVTNVFINVVPL